MKEKPNDGTHTRPLLDKLKGDYREHLKGDLVQTILAIPTESFEVNDIEFVFQLLEAELRATDAGHIQNSLTSLKDKLANSWPIIVAYANEIERGKVSSAVSHQLIALIQLTDEA
ncbi:hypothetical protein BFP97_11045 [Roseivirga sp. 4D4]|uniref:hypothetical protein n=1 Tax=Roseivirga sp. 4D4 TaxID=1889784 RepID=UPI00085375ED|nr:hypothetical protein [Roseivirga sp. 4D4]OEK02023.1 hypothetical protein BFP97_11045 [Roseivirga sp. 4D4]